MGKHIDDMELSSTGAGTYLPSETHMLTDETGYDWPVLVLDDGDKEVRIEGTAAAIMAFGQQIKDSGAAAQQRGFEIATGFMRGEKVRIGKGEGRWVIESFSWASGGPGTQPVLYASLKQDGGYNNTSANVDRLTKIEEE